MNQEKPTPPEDVNLSSLDASEAISLLRKYNEQFGWGPTAVRMMMSGPIEGQDEETTDTTTSAMDDQAAEQLMSFDEMKAGSASVLDTIGLEYRPVKANWFAAGGNETHRGSEISLNLKDGAKFVKYLRSLNPESATESQRNGLREIILVLTKQFNSYSLDDPSDDRLLEFMGSVSALIIEYKRIFGENAGTLPSGISKLETYLSYARKGCLSEYRRVEALTLDKPPTGDGFVLRWHIDASPKSLQEHWDEVIDTLKKVSENEKAKELYGIARENAAKALDSAIKEVSAMPDEARDKKAFLAILKTTKSRMSEF